jgi:predicted acylesterase/phospholipase RssA
MRYVLNSFMIMIAEITEYRLRVCPPQVIIRPEIPVNVTLLTGFERAAEVIAAGEAAADAAIGAIWELIAGEPVTPAAPAACGCAQT